jgi:polyisoprenoid-binding protein YceI
MFLIVLLIFTASGLYANDQKKSEKETGKKAMIDWKIDANHTSVEFSVKHLMVSNVKGSFDTFSGSICGDEKGHLHSIEGTVPISSINTNNTKRDEHLKSADFFDVAKYPSMTFKSKKITYVGNKVTVIGDLAIKNITKETTFTGEFLGKTKANFGAGDEEHIGYSFEGKIKRKEFGINFSGVMNGNAIVDDTIKILLDLECSRSL